MTCQTCHALHICHTFIFEKDFWVSFFNLSNDDDDNHDDDNGDDDDDDDDDNDGGDDDDDGNDDDDDNGGDDDDDDDDHDVEDDDDDHDDNDDTDDHNDEGEPGQDQPHLDQMIKGENSPSFSLVVSVVLFVCFALFWFCLFVSFHDYCCLFVVQLSYIYLFTIFFYIYFTDRFSF